VPFKDVGSLRIFHFDSLDHPELVHAVFTRRGGVSRGAWRSLNVGALVGDDAEHVRENRRRIFTGMGRETDSAYEVWQVHSARVMAVEEPRGSREIEKADAMVTDKRHVTLLMRFADCVPIIAFDPMRIVVGLAHAGWLGTTRRVAEALITTMQRRYGCRPADIRAGIGPSIAAHHYEVGPEVVDAMRASFGEEADRHMRSIDGQTHLDLWSANQALLERSGVGQIEISGLCSACDEEDWYSHRAQSGKTGRFGVAVALNDA
jgi:YfiH family protein